MEQFDYRKRCGRIITDRTKALTGQEVKSSQQPRVPARKDGNPGGAKDEVKKEGEVVMS